MTRKPSRTRAAILAAASSLAAEKGITGTTMDEIAERAGVAKGSLYYNFESKDAIFTEVLEQALIELDESFAAARQSREGVAALRAIVTVLLETIRRNPQTSRILAAEIFRTDRSWLEPLSRARGRVLGQMKDVIDEIARTSDRQVPNSQLLAAAAFGAVVVAALEWLVFEPEIPEAEIVDTLITPVVRLAS